VLLGLLLLLRVDDAGNQGPDIQRQLVVVKDRLLAAFLGFDQRFPQDFALYMKRRSSLLATHHGVHDHGAPGDGQVQLVSV
jgi:hypothetical protein